MATGNGEQTLSRDIYRLGQRFDFFRMLSVYFTTVGFYFSTLVCMKYNLFSYIYCMVPYSYVNHYSISGFDS